MKNTAFFSSFLASIIIRSRHLALVFPTILCKELDFVRHNRFRSILIIIVSVSIFPKSLSCQLSIPSIFSDNMILQRNKPVCIWGKALPSQKVLVTLGNLQEVAKTKQDSTWTVTFPSHRENANPTQLIINSLDESIVLGNILIGDVWLCIGQSNMEWPMHKELHYKEEYPSSLNPLLRFYNPTYIGKDLYGAVYPDTLIEKLRPESLFNGRWESSDTLSIKVMSAVAYYFAKKVVEEIHIPIGLIHLGVGGAPLETFIDVDVIKKHPIFFSKVQGDWLENDSYPVWVRERGKQNVGSVHHMPSDKYGKNHAFKPGFVYSAGIKPISKMPITGILCYQGESNAQEMERVMEYAELSNVMVNSYRKVWNDTNIPFYFVQLSSIDTVKYNGQLWPLFRDEQRKMVDLIPRSGMVVSSDVGSRNDVHPLDKRTVGHRLALLALQKTYGKNIISSGPTPIDAIYRDGKVTLRFNKKSGPLMTKKNDVLKGFSCEDGVERSAYILFNEVIIPVDKKPKYIHYGWQPYNEGNLINSNLLPASTFRLEVK